MKTVKFMMIVIALGFSALQAFAADTITCKVSNNEIFSFRFGTHPNSGIANDLHPVGVAIKSFPIEIYGELPIVWR